MMTILAALSVQQLATVFVHIIVVALICWLLWWFISWVGIPEPFNKILRAIVGLGAVIFLINALLSLTGKPFITW